MTAIGWIVASTLAAFALVSGLVHFSMMPETRETEHGFIAAVLLGAMAAVVVFVGGIIIADSYEEPARRAAWIADCTGRKFTTEQCDLLYGVHKGNQDAQTAAAFATGLAAGGAAAGGRR